MRTTTTGAAAALAALGLAAAGCGGGTAADAAGGTVTIAIPADPGTLDPLNALASSAISINAFSYARLVHLAPDGSLTGGVAERWSATTTSARFTIRQGVTCESGQPMTAADVAAQYNHIADPRNASPLLGLAVPVTASATADEATRTVTVKMTKPAPFILEMTQLLPLVCKKGLADPKALSRATDASGPYRLTEAVPGDHYTFAKRPGHTWGPGGATMTAAPDRVVFKVVANEATAANLLLSGQADIVQINGADQQRLAAARALKRGVRVPLGQFLFHQGSGHPTADPAVRRALVAAVDLKQLGGVATGGRGVPATDLGMVPPTPCKGDPVTGNVPGHDAARAAADLTAAGWTKTGGRWTKDGRELALTVAYPTILGPQVVSAVELAVQRWTAFGVRVTTKTMTPATVAQTLASDGWDLAWSPISVYLPDQLLRFYDGPRPPRGTNFGGVDNPEYRGLAGQASAKQGRAGCDLWTRAASALVKRLDVVPFVSAEKNHYGRGVTFQVDGSGVLPHTLRRTGS